MTTAKQLLQIKGYDIHTIEPTVPAQTALELMADKNIGALVVLDGTDLAGIFSERDYVRAVARNKDLARETPVKEIMISKVVCVKPNRTVQECMALMTEKRIRHLPVVDDDKLVGIISIGDVVKAVISQQEFIIEQLEMYISQ